MYMPNLTSIQYKEETNTFKIVLWILFKRREILFSLILPKTKLLIMLYLFNIFYFKTKKPLTNVGGGGAKIEINKNGNKIIFIDKKLNLFV